MAEHIVNISGYVGTTTSITDEELEEMDEDELRQWAYTQLSRDNNLHDVSTIIFENDSKDDINF